LLSTRGHALETLAHATDFVFDKTGTLTTGEFKLLEIEVMRGDREAGLGPGPRPGTGRDASGGGRAARGGRREPPWPPIS
jgi:magnesium-transporting ATPase (P-type)